MTGQWEAAKAAVMPQWMSITIGDAEKYGASPTVNLEAHGQDGHGAVLRPNSTCPGCGNQFAVGDVLTALLKPNMSGSWQHTDCHDPTLENDSGLGG